MNAERHNNDAPQRSGDAEEAAAFWDARLRRPDCSKEDRAQYEAWRASDPNNGEAFERLQDTLEALRSAGSRPVLRALRDAALRKRRRRFVFVGGGLAAALAFGILTNALIAGQRTDSQHIASNAPNQAEAVQVRVYETDVGERRDITLEDGSVITLNTRSRLEERFSVHRRDIRLVQGQALFAVAHDANRPFVVTAANRQVTAIGTRFDVRLDGANVHVVLVEGRVAIARRPQAGILAEWLPNRRELNAGEEYQSSENFFQPASVRPADVTRATLWQEGRVAFVDAPLPEAIAEMNRYSTGALVVTDPSMAEIRVSGVFRTSEPQAFINAIEQYYPVEAREQPGGDTLLVWRD